MTQKEQPGMVAGAALAQRDKAAFFEGFAFGSESRFVSLTAKEAWQRSQARNEPDEPFRAAASSGAAPAQEPGLDLKWKAASEFIRDVLFALGKPEPAAEAVVDLPAIALDVLGQIEELKFAATSAAAQEPTRKSVKDLETSVHYVVLGLRDGGVDLALSIAPEKQARWVSDALFARIFEPLAATSEGGTETRDFDCLMATLEAVRLLMTNGDSVDALAELHKALALAERFKPPATSAGAQEPERTLNFPTLKYTVADKGRCIVCAANFRTGEHVYRDIEPDTWRCLAHGPWLAATSAGAAPRCPICKNVVVECSFCAQDRLAAQEPEASYWCHAIDLVTDMLMTLKAEEFEGRRDKLVATLRNASSRLAATSAGAAPLEAKLETDIADVLTCFSKWKSAATTDMTSELEDSLNDLMHTFKKHRVAAHGAGRPQI